jgi:hypothetical protein
MPHTEPALGKTLLNDVKHVGFFLELKREWQDIRSFYISEEKRDRLAKMNRLKRWFVMSWWVLKAMFLKLTPFRRILLVLGIVFIASVRTSVTTGHGDGVSFEGAPFLGLVVLLIVLALELKDKLLARSELQAGRVVQAAMRPEQSPEVTGWNLWLFTRPANEVGGDLVDFMRLGGDRYGIAIGDVSGKGLGAALLMVKIQATLRALAPDFPSPASFMTKLNQILSRDHIPGSFTSLIFLHLSAASTGIRYVNAGHMRPLHLTGEQVVELPKGDVALGLASDSAYAEQSLTIGRGQSLILYSDGVVEAQNKEGEFFGLERFKGLCTAMGSLSPRAFGEKLVADVERFIGSARGMDDLSLVILQREGV